MFVGLHQPSHKMFVWASFSVAASITTFPGEHRSASFIVHNDLYLLHCIPECGSFVALVFIQLQAFVRHNLSGHYDNTTYDIDLLCLGKSWCFLFFLITGVLAFLKKSSRRSPFITSSYSNWLESLRCCGMRRDDRTDLRARSCVEGGCRRLKHELQTTAVRCYGRHHRAASVWHSVGHCL